MELKTESLKIAKLAVALELTLKSAFATHDERLEAFKQAYEAIDALVGSRDRSTTGQSGRRLITDRE